MISVCFFNRFKWLFFSLLLLLLLTMITMMMVVDNDYNGTLLLLLLLSSILYFLYSHHHHHHHRSSTAFFLYFLPLPRKKRHSIEQAQHVEDIHRNRFRKKKHKKLGSKKKDKLVFSLSLSFHPPNEYFVSQ